MANKVKFLNDIDVVGNIKVNDKELPKLIAGEGNCSVVQEQGGAYGSKGNTLPQSKATGINAVALGAENEAHGSNTFIAGGHGNKTYQFDGAAFGGDNIVGSLRDQRIFEGLLDTGAKLNREQGKAEFATLGDQISYINYNWADVQDKWNDNHAAALKAKLIEEKWELSDEDDCKIDYSSFSDAQHSLKYSFGFSAGTSNKVTGRAAAAFGTHLIASTENKFAAGSFNEDKGSDTIFEVGYGYITGSTTVRRNALEVRSDGSARVATQGTSDDSIVRYDTVKGYVKHIDIPKDENNDPWMGAVYSITSDNDDYIIRATNGYMDKNGNVMAYTIARRDDRGACQFATPKYDQDAATKGYVDSKILAGISTPSDDDDAEDGTIYLMYEE